MVTKRPRAATAGPRSYGPEGAAGPTYLNAFPRERKIALRLKEIGEPGICAVARGLRARAERRRRIRGRAVRSGIHARRPHHPRVGNSLGQPDRQHVQLQPGRIRHRIQGHRRRPGRLRWIRRPAVVLFNPCNNCVQIPWGLSAVGIGYHLDGVQGLRLTGTSRRRDLHRARSRTGATHASGP